MSSRFLNRWRLCFLKNTVYSFPKCKNSVKFIHIFSILSMKNFENQSESEFISEKAEID